MYLIKINYFSFEVKIFFVPDNAGFSKNINFNCSRGYIQNAFNLMMHHFMLHLTTVNILIGKLVLNFNLPL